MPFRQLLALFFFCFIVLEQSSAQDSLFVDWARNLDLNQASYQGANAALGDDNSIYVVTMADRFFDNFEKDEIQLYGTKQDIWISKYDEIGGRVWVQQIRDSANSVASFVAVHDDVVLVSGSTNGWRSFADNTNGDTIPGGSPVAWFIALYDANTGDLIKQVDVPFNYVLSGFDFDNQGNIWLISNMNAEVDIDFTSEVELVNYSTHPNFTGTFALPDMLLVKMDQEFNLLQYKQFPCYGKVQPRHLSISGNDVWVAADYQSSIETDTIVFNQDTALISPSNDRDLMIHLDTSMNVLGALILDELATINGLSAVDGDLIFSGTYGLSFSGLVDTTLNTSLLTNAWGIYDGNSLSYFGTSDELTAKGKRNGNYLLNDSDQKIVVKSGTNVTLQNLEPIGLNDLSHGITLLQNKVSGDLGFYGQFFFDLNLGTEDRPYLLHGPALGTMSDTYFGLISSDCPGGIVDSTEYSSPQIQCGIHLVDEQIDVRGHGLRYQWYNTRKQDSLVDVVGFDRCGYAQYILGVTGKRLEYQWCVETQSIEGVYVVHIEDGCKNTFQTDTISIKSYGKPEILGATAISDTAFQTGDTLVLDIAPIPGFDTIVYNWVKNDFFLYDFGRWTGTTTPHFELQGVGAQDAGIYRCFAFHPNCPEYVDKTVDLPIAIEGDTTVWNEWALGVSDLIPQDLVDVYPSVFDNELNIMKKTQSNEVYYQAVDLKGNLQKSGKVDFGRNVINSTGWPPGMYLLQIISETGFQQLKLVKENE